MEIIIFLSVLWITIVILHYYLWWKYIKLKEAKEHEYYTDYVHGRLVLRIYKPEFEFQAKDGLVGKMLDEGILSPSYNWVLWQR